MIPLKKFKEVIDFAVIEKDNCEKIKEKLRSYYMALNR